jgi:hypothetical protein
VNAPTHLLFILLCVLSVTPASASGQGNWLAARLDKFPGSAAFLNSYDAPDVHQAIVAYTYDQALTIMAFLAEKDIVRARRIADAMVFAQAFDRTYHDGRLRNAYEAGAVDAKPVKLPGYWDNMQRSWIEDSYQDGSATGNNAWAGLALLKISAATNDAKYAEAARRIGKYLIDVVGPHEGFRGGFEGFDDHPETLGWKSTEHNIDTAAFLRVLDKRYPNQGFIEAANAASRFIDSMWDGDHYLTGTLPDGKTPNRTFSSLDAQTFAILFDPDASARGQQSLAYLERLHGVPGGFDYSDSKAGIWLEGTAQTALAYDILGEPNKTKLLLESLHRLSKNGELNAVAGINGAPVTELNTGLRQGNGSGLNWSYFPYPAVAPVAWLILADNRINPLAP